MHIFVDVDDRMMWTAAGDFSLHICNIVVLVIKAPLPSIRVFYCEWFLTKEAPRLFFH